MPEYRSGTKNPHTLYFGDQPVGCVFDPDDAPDLIAGANALERERERVTRTIVERDALQARLDALTDVDQEWARRLTDEHRAAVRKVAEYGERIDELQTEVVRCRAALAQIAEHGPADDPADPCWRVAQTARAALTPEAEEATR